MALPRLLIVHPSNELYGSDRVLLESVRVLQRSWSIEVWLPTDVNYPDRLLSAALSEMGIPSRDINLPVFRRAFMSPKYGFSYMRKFSTVMAELRKKRPDAVYVNTSALAPVVLATRLLRIPTVVHIHEYLAGLPRRVISPMLAGPARLVTVSNAITRVLSDGLQKKTRVIYNGFDIVPLPPAESPSPLTFTVASRWTPGKGYAELFDAWALVKREDVRLNVLGGPPPSGEIYDVVARAATLPNADTVSIIGEVNDIRGVMAESHAVIIPSKSPDSLPTLAIEANALGRAAFVSENPGGIAEIVESGTTGVFFDLDAPTDLARLIEQATVTSLRQMGSAGRERFDKLFSRERYAREINEVFSNLRG